MTAKKNITIKNALESDKLYIDKLAKDLNISLSEALSVIVNQEKTDIVNLKKTKENLEETEKIQLENHRLTIELQKKSEEYQILKTQELQTIEKTIEVEKKLTGTQFICELDEKTAYNVRKVRSFAIKNSIVVCENEKEYANAFTNVAVKQFLKRHFIDYID